MISILLVILVVIAIVGLPTWYPNSDYNYGYYPSGVIVLIILVLLIWLLR